MNMNILVAFNDNYAMPTRVMLKSLIENNREIIHIYVLYISLSEESIKELSTLNSDSTTLHFIRIDDAKLKNVPITLFYSKEAYIRLFAHLYLPADVDRILWLDSDVIINGDIQEFYKQSFEGKLYVAYKDPIQGDSAEKKTSLGMPPDAVYINSGVLLMNIAKIRGKINPEDITNYIRNYYDRIKFVDQDVFNGLLYDSIRVIESEDYTYNYFVSHITRRNRHMVYQNARIIHYAMGSKPWKKGFVYYGFHLWWRYALMAEKSYKKKYSSNYPSYIWARSKHGIAAVIKHGSPNVYRKLKEFKNKISKEKLGG